MTTEMKRENLYPGLKIGFLKLIQRVAPNMKTKSASIRKRWRVECVCGQRLTVPETYLIRKPQPKTHCGCKEVKSIKTIYHQEYGIWCMMRQRCYFQTHIAYRHYGGRGIRICDEWLNDFEAFLKDVGPRPSPKHSIDRIDPNGHYEKFHRVTGELQVRWATGKQQMANTRAAYAARKAAEAREQRTGEVVLTQAPVTPTGS